jgi:hypothetical protein
MTPNEVRTGTRTGQRSTWASTRAIAGGGGTEAFPAGEGHAAAL